MKPTSLASASFPPTSSRLVRWLSCLLLIKHGRLIVFDCRSRMCACLCLCGSGLAGEQVRWRESVERFDAQILALVGDVLLSAGCISYYGPFTGKQSSDCVRLPMRGCSGHCRHCFDFCPSKPDICYIAKFTAKNKEQY